MAKHAFAAYKINISEHGNPMRRLRVNDLNNQGLDILDILHDAVKGLQRNRILDETRQNYLTVETYSLEGREVRVRLNYGNYGTPGSIQDVHDPRSRRDHDETEATTTHFRGLLVAEPLDRFLILTTERYRGRGAGTMFLHYLKEYVDARVRGFGLIMKYEAVADPAAFARFLERARLTELEVIDRSPQSDLFGEQNETPIATVTHTAKPVGKAQWLPNPLRDQLLHRSINTRQLFGINDDDTRPRGELEIRLTLSDDKQQRKVVLSDEEQATPLVYLLAEDSDDRPEDDHVYARMRETCREIRHHLQLDSD